MRTWLAISLGLVALQCGGLERTTGEDLCRPGSQINCECGRDMPSVRTCATDGIGYGACICGGSTTATGGGGSSGNGGAGGTGGAAGLPVH